MQSELLQQRTQLANHTQRCSWPEAGKAGQKTQALQARAEMRQELRKGVGSEASRGADALARQ